jgi:quaternary ammonium compound-resistance protein SugE
MREYAMADTASLALLLAAGIMEVGFATSLKMTSGFSAVLPTVAAVVFGLGSFVFLGLALKTLPVGATYAAWTGFGMAGTALVGVLVFGEKMTWQTAVGMLLIVAGVVLVNLARGSQA